MKLYKVTAEVTTYYLAPDDAAAGVDAAEAIMDTVDAGNFAGRGPVEVVSPDGVAPDWLDVEPYGPYTGGDEFDDARTIREHFDAKAEGGGE